MYVFELSKEQCLKITEWIEKHDAEAHGGLNRNVGAIGGAYTYEFTPTSLGTVSKVRCSCNVTLDVSDYDSW